tara:strand:- start:94 stop:465 length:372 start_codon:yes stop_codon:yes gene_type:complete
MYRGEVREVSQEWLNKYRHWARQKGPKNLIIEGDEGITADEGNDGLPDSGWTKKDITGWLKDKGVTVTGYATKAKLLDKVKTTLNPPAPEPVVEEVALESVAEKVVEETITEDTIVKTDGVEE